MSNRHFSERINEALTEIGLPEVQAERIEAFSKLLHIPKFKSEAILTGQLKPDPALLAIIARELDVTPNYLLGDPL